MQDTATQAGPQTIHLSDYLPVVWLAESTDLTFELHEDHARVSSVVRYLPNPARPEAHAAGGDRSLVLDGIDLETETVTIGGIDADYRIEADPANDGARLIVTAPEGPFELRVVNRIKPQENTTMEGLYRSTGMFCTQMEAEGFRRVTWYQDRPDVLATWTVTIEADAGKYPVLLSNGNLVEREDLGGGRVRARWHDPFPKPAYLFALVAGDLDITDDTFTTKSGRRVNLRVLVDKGNLDQSLHAMDSLKKSMRWDERVFGREYDLDVFHIVAVHDFNMGAMENKSLNIFNASAVLAKAETATDSRFARIEAIVAHEYFHNWTGNRITCRDWFQLSLKEGLTVFRDQEFSSDMNHRGVQRIGDVRNLRGSQFIEDAGPMAHAVRPASYIEINNFYTTTIYEKGAEVIRMMHTLLGAEAFRRGTDLYFERHDGQAVTCDDFLAAIRDGGGHTLAGFERWYSQAGTPQLNASWAWDAAAGTFDLTLRQSTTPTPGQPAKLPLHIPVRTAFIGPDGARVLMRLEAEEDGLRERVLSLTEAEQTWRFVGLAAAPVPSLLRGFSAPVKLVSELSADDLRHLASHDDDFFNRWEAVQLLATRELMRLVSAVQAGETPTLDSAFKETIRRLISADNLEAAFVAEAVRLPSEALLAEEMAVVDVDAIHAARHLARVSLGEELGADWLALLQRQEAIMAGRPYTFNAMDAGNRALKNVALAYLAAAGDTARCMAQLLAADNMTDELTALTLLADVDCEERTAALARFYERWQGDSLVMNSWFSVQASASRDGVSADVASLAQHPAFDASNPNKVRALYTSFAMNPRHFHAADGSGYNLLADRIIAIDKGNPILSGRLARLYSAWSRMDAGRKAICEQVLRRILATEGLSKNAYETVSKTLGAA